MNDLDFSELQDLLEQLKTLKAESEIYPGLLNVGICCRANLLRWHHMLDWPKHSGYNSYPIDLKDWEVDMEEQYFQVAEHEASPELALQYIELRKELLDFLINKTEKEISERQQKGNSNEQ